MNTFPTLSSGPKIEGFTSEFGDAAVSIGAPKFGAPILNEKTTFDARHFGFTLRPVSQANKETIETFYQVNKNLVFYWLNEQDSVTYEVVFFLKPHCELDGEKDLWKIAFRLIQA